jgi:glycosyltransferase involved in cell wall biosynthesis
VLAQTFSDFEVVIVDNRSTGKSVPIASGYAERDPRARVFRNARRVET